MVVAILKTKTLTVTVGFKMGLPDYSSATVEITEEVELEDGDVRKEIMAKLHTSLEKFAMAKLDGVKANPRFKHKGGQG